MTLRNSYPGPSGVTTTTDARIVIGGMIDDFATGVPRVGVFPSNLNAIVTARTDMNVDIAAFTGVANQFGGPILIGNDGTIQLPSVLVSPASGTNFYVLYVKQDESTAPGTDADNLVKAGSTLSTVSFAAARALLPTGAFELATVQVPTGVAATNAGGVTITQTFVYTATEGGVVPVRNTAELTAWTPADGSLAYQIDITTLWQRAGGQWVIVFGKKNYTGVPTGGAQANGATVVSQAIPSRPYAQRVIVAFAGGIVGSGSGAGGYVVTPVGGGTVTGNMGQVAVSSSGVSYAGQSVVDIPANTAVTIAINVTATVNLTWQTGSWTMRVLAAGEY